MHVFIIGCLCSLGIFYLAVRVCVVYKHLDVQPFEMCRRMNISIFDGEWLKAGHLNLEWEYMRKQKCRYTCLLTVPYSLSILVTHFSVCLHVFIRGRGDITFGSKISTRRKVKIWCQCTKLCDPILKNLSSFCKLQATVQFQFYQRSKANQFRKKSSILNPEFRFRLFLVYFVSRHKSVNVYYSAANVGKACMVSRTGTSLCTLNQFIILSVVLTANSGNTH